MRQTTGGLRLSAKSETETRRGGQRRTVMYPDGVLGRLYAKSREEGLRRAYAAACGVANLWDVRESSVAGVTVIVNILRRDERVSLVLLRLPDGSPDGTGTARGKGQSLQRLLL